MQTIRNLNETIQTLKEEMMGKTKALENIKSMRLGIGKTNTCTYIPEDICTE